MYKILMIKRSNLNSYFIGEEFENKEDAIIRANQEAFNKANKYEFKIIKYFIVNFNIKLELENGE